jgi:hypothetical protein
MRELVPALHYITVALGDEAPLVARRLAMLAAALVVAAALLVVR